MAIRRREFLRYGALGLVVVAAPTAVLRARRSGPGAGTITRCVIHPAIGVARVGNSPDEFFIAPEVPGPQLVPPGGYKDAAGRIKRQAVRFRVFGLDADGNVVKELTADDAEITWTVHPANKKASWYEFDLALDIPEARDGTARPGKSPDPPVASKRRNASVRGGDRAQLVIDPGPRTIAGANVNEDGGDGRYAFDSGRFFDRTVPLGELRTDAAGRLLVLGGFGASGPATPGTPITGFSNNDGWHDDTSDGPVEAMVRIGDEEFQAEGAWVAVAPPDFAPSIQGMVTLYDLLFEVAVRLEPERRPVRPSFTRQIYPLFERHTQHQWVNAGFARDFGWGASGNPFAPEQIPPLADPSVGARPVREQVFRRFRNPDYATIEPRSLPPYYGDDIDFPAVSPRQWMAVLPLQYEWLRQWAAGDFEADWPADGIRYPERLEDLPAEEQPGALDRAALDACLGGPFHPGCELTWPMRQMVLYSSPFRIRRRTTPEPDWGDAITSAIALRADGPLSGSGPGDLTRWMAVPWQTDTGSCLSAYTRDLDEFLPTFWPARVPNDILTAAAYDTVLDTNAPIALRRAAFAQRAKWLRTLPASSSGFLPYLADFARGWSRQGIMTRRSGPGDDAFPGVAWVESGYTGPPPVERKNDAGIGLPVRRRRESDER